MLPPAVRGDGARRLHPAGGVRPQDEGRAGVLLLDDDAVREGLALTKVYRENSPTALVVVGLLNAASAGLLHYMALVELLAADFMGPRLQGSVRL